MKCLRLASISLIIRTASLNLCETNGSNIMKKEGFYGPSCLNLYDILQFVRGSVMNKQARKCLPAASG